MDVHACAQRGGVLWQCSEACSCGDECWARLTRRGLCVPVVLRHGPAGWACYAASPVRRGTFLAEYAGVVLTSAEADAALRAYDAEGTGHALLVVREAMLDGIVARRVMRGAGDAGSHLLARASRSPIRVPASGRTWTRRARGTSHASSTTAAGHPAPSTAPTRPC